MVHLQGREKIPTFVLEIKTTNIMEKALSNNERIILENINKQYQWIARDESGDLYVYEDKPQKKDGYCWRMYDGFCGFSAFNHLFQMVQWKDDKPTLIADLLKEK